MTVSLPEYRNNRKQTQISLYVCCNITLSCLNSLDGGIKSPAFLLESVGLSLSLQCHNELKGQAERDLLLSGHQIRL